MKTLAIDSLDDLPDAAEAVIDALAGRTVVAFRGEMGAGKTTPHRRDPRPSGFRRHGHQPHLRAGQPVRHGRRTPRLPLRLLPHRPHRGGLRLRLRRVFLFGQPLSGGVARKKSRSCSPRRHDDGSHPRGRPRAAHAVHRLRRPDEPAGRRTVAVRRRVFARRSQMRGFCTRRITSESA